VLNETGEAEKAPCAYLEAIAKFHQDVVSDPSSAVAHQHLGDALTNKLKADNCASNNTSNEKTLKELDPYDSAIAEYQRAAGLDPEDAHIHYDLGSKLLESPGLADKSIDELREALERHEGPEALKRREGPNDSFDEFKYVLLKTLSHALRIKARNREAFIDCLKGKFEHQEANELFCEAFRDNEALIERAEKKALIDKKPNDNAAAYRRRGADLYLMGKFNEAVAAHNVALGIDETYLADRIERGYALFALADFADAVRDFGHAQHLPQGQADTMIWLYLSLERSRSTLDDEYYKQKREELQRNASKVLESDRQDWPVPIIKLFLDKQFNQPPADVLNSAEDVLKSANDADKCKAYFYVGEWHALDNRPEEASKLWKEEASRLLKQAEQICQFDSVERLAAQAELKRLPTMARTSPP
jgi:tetratricopeptide (TPR) repeat protein